MIKVPVIISGPENSTVDDLINGGREVIARNGFQVGDFDYELETEPGEIIGDMELPSADTIKDGHDLGWGEFSVRKQEPE